MIEKKLFSHISPLIGGNIFPIIAPEKVQTPFAVYTIVNDKDLISLQGENYANKTRIQIDLYGKSYSEVKETLAVVKNSLYEFEYKVYGLNSRDLYEEQTGLFRQLIEFYINNKE